MALVIAGIFSVTPSEKCTRYWASSGVFVAISVLVLILNSGAPRYPALIVGNNFLIIGMILQWRGIRAFYKKPSNRVGWTIGIIFFVAYAALLLLDAPVTGRAMLSSGAIVSVLSLDFREIWTNQRKHSFPSMVALSATMLLIVSFGFRFVAILFQLAELMPDTNSILSITVMYLVPIAGIMLFSSALMLLYFERLVADKHYLATHDELTGVLNRRAIVASGEREVEVAIRTGRPVAIAYVDIDHFKEINDKFGHTVGDHVLIDVATTLKRACRNIDLFGRYGGEEFCIVFPGVGCGNLTDIGERLVSAVRAHRFDHDLAVTISIGLAASKTDAEYSWTGLIRRADDQLYKAKGAGRNRYSSDC